MCILWRQKHKNEGIKSDNDSNEITMEYIIQRRLINIWVFRGSFIL